MKHSHPHRVTAASSSALRRDVRRSSTTKTIVPRTQVEEELQLAHVKLGNEVRQVAESCRRGTTQNCTGVARRVWTGLDRPEIRSGMAPQDTRAIACFKWWRGSLEQSPSHVGIGRRTLGVRPCDSGGPAPSRAGRSRIGPGVEMPRDDAPRSYRRAVRDRRGPGLVIHRAAIRNVCRVVSNRAGIVDERDASRLRFAGSHMAVPGRRQGDVRSN